MNLSERIQSLRKARGLSQEELAERIGVSLSQTPYRAVLRSLFLRVYRGLSGGLHRRHPVLPLQTQPISRPSRKHRAPKWVA